MSRRQKKSQPMHDTLRSPTSMMQQELAPAQPQQSPMATRRTRSERAAMTAAAPTKMAFLVARAATRKCVFVESVSLEMTFRPVARVAGLPLPRPAYRRRAAPTPGARAARTRSSRSRRPLCSRCARSSLAAWRLDSNMHTGREATADGGGGGGVGVGWGREWTRARWRRAGPCGPRS